MKFAEQETTPTRGNGMKKGFTPAFDRLFDPTHHLADEPACRRWAWLDMCHMASHKERVQIVKGSVVELPRGCFIASERFLAERWNWSRGKVRRFIEVLHHPAIEKLETIGDTKVGTIYMVVKYDTYRKPRPSDDTSDEDRGKTNNRPTDGTSEVVDIEEDTTNPGPATGPVTGPQAVPLTGPLTDQREEVKEETEETAFRGANEKPKSRATRLPKSWEPTKAHVERAKDTNLDLSTEVEKFRLHAKEKGRTSKCWNSAFTTWLINAVEFRKRRRGAGPYRDPSEGTDWEKEAREINQGA